MLENLDALAQRQWRDYQARSPGTLFAEPHTLDLADAYRLQAAVSTLRIGSGDRVAGYKIGCTGAGTIQQFGVAGPVRGYLYQSEIHKSGDRLDTRSFASLAIEGEMAVRIGTDGRSQAAFPVLELHNFVFRGVRKTLVELVANNCLNAGVVLPPSAWLVSSCYLTTHAALQVLINGRLIDSADPWPSAGGAEVSLAWLRAHLGEHGLSLAPGDLVLTGTPLGLYLANPGDHVAVGLDGQVVTECRVI